MTSGTVPSWYVSPEQQLAVAESLNRALSWGFKPSDFPTIPVDSNLHDGEMLLACVYLPDTDKLSGLSRTILELWFSITAPDGYGKWCSDGLRFTDEHWRSVPAQAHRPGIRWMAFNPTAHFGESPEELIRRRREEGVRLAGTEVLMAMLLFPDWAASWNGDSSPYPNLSGLEHCWFPDETTVYGWHPPHMRRWDRQSKTLALIAGSEDSRPQWSSPTVREC